MREDEREGEKKEEGWGACVEKKYLALKDKLLRYYVISQLGNLAVTISLKSSFDLLKTHLTLALKAGFIPPSMTHKFKIQGAFRVM